MLSPALLVARQLAQELAGALIAPLRFAAFLARHRRERDRVGSALGVRVPFLPPPAPRPDRPVDGPPRTVLVAAGEASGDLHAASLVRELRARRASLRVVAFGGERLRDAGAEIAQPMGERAVMGLLGGLASVPRHVALARRFVETIDREKPAVCVLVDNPGFHLVLASLARARGVPAVQYVCPQTWAWAPWRNARLRRSVARALAIVPFEVPYFESFGVRVRYVGHPLGDDLAARAVDAAAAARLREGGPLVVLMPGSRHAEVERNLPAMLRVAAQVHRAMPAARFALSLRAGERAAQADAILARERPALEVMRPEVSLDTLLKAASLAIAKSGTGTLEVAHYGVPLIVFYKLARRFDRWLSRAMLTVPNVSMLNLLAARHAVPEVLAVDARDEAKTAELAVKLLTSEAARNADLAAMEEVRPRFDRPGAAARAAQQVLDLLGS